MPGRLLLISTSTVHGTGYLEHAMPELRLLLQDVRRVLFIPFALKDHDAYAAKARQAFGRIGCEVDSLHDAVDARAALEGAPAVFCGGGNTFRLLRALYERDALPLLRRRVASGMPYAGASAGANLACPTLKTTNDMPIVEPPSFEALGLVPFQINPHYLDPDPTSRHMGETRETRIREFHEENQTPVVGLREGAMLLVDEGQGLAQGPGRGPYLPARAGGGRGASRRAPRFAARLSSSQKLSSRPGFPTPAPAAARHGSRHRGPARSRPSAERRCSPPGA